MPHAAKLIAVDLGASSGRVLAAHWDGRAFALEELHRFPNGPVNVAGSLYWNVLGLWTEIQSGLTKYREKFRETPAGISVDAWGVDYALLDKHGRLLGNPYHYRDARTDGLPAEVFARVPAREIFAETGVQTMQINTLFQLYGMARRGDVQLTSAAALLMIPDYFHYLLCGDQSVEYTNATTTQMYSGVGRAWAGGLLERLEIPAGILPQVIQPGTLLPEVRAAVLREAGMTESFPVIAGASHDTASAVAAIPNMDGESVFISSGTWSLMGVELDEPLISDEAFALNFTNEGSARGRTVLLKNITGMWTLQECMREWWREGRRYSWPELMQLAAEARPLGALFDPDAPAFLAPQNMPQAICEHFRKRAEPAPETAGAIARSCLESLALRYRWTLEALESLTGRRFRTIRVVGGGSLNALLCQLTADACGRRVVAGPVEASALGNIMVQAIATGHLADFAEGQAAIAASVVCESYEPREDDAWDGAYARMKGMFRPVQGS